MKSELNVFFKMLFKTFGAILVLYWSQSSSLGSLPEATEPGRRL